MPKATSQSKRDLSDGATKKSPLALIASAAATLRHSRQQSQNPPRSPSSESTSGAEASYTDSSPSNEQGTQLKRKAMSISSLSSSENLSNKKRQTKDCLLSANEPLTSSGDSGESEPEKRLDSGNEERPQNVAKNQPTGTPLKKAPPAKKPSKRRKSAIHTTPAASLKNYLDAKGEKKTLPHARSKANEHMRVAPPPLPPPPQQQQQHPAVQPHVGNATVISEVSKFDLHVKLATVEGQLQQNPNMTFEEAKLAAKREYNRRNAARARQRGKYLLEELQETCASLTQRTEELASENEKLKKNIRVLEQKEMEYQARENASAATGEVHQFNEEPQQQQKQQVPPNLAPQIQVPQAPPAPQDANIPNAFPTNQLPVGSGNPNQTTLNLLCQLLQTNNGTAEQQPPQQPPPQLPMVQQQPSQQDQSKNDIFSSLLQSLVPKPPAASFPSPLTGPRNVAPGNTNNSANDLIKQLMDQAMQQQQQQQRHQEQQDQEAQGALSQFLQQVAAAKNSGPPPQQRAVTSNTFQVQAPAAAQLQQVDNWLRNAKPQGNNPTNNWLQPQVSRTEASTEPQRSPHWLQPQASQTAELNTDSQRSQNWLLPQVAPPPGASSGVNPSSNPQGHHLGNLFPRQGAQQREVNNATTAQLLAFLQASSNNNNMMMGPNKK